MFKRMFKYIVALIGASIGITIGSWAITHNYFKGILPTKLLTEFNGAIIIAIVSIIFGLIFFILAPPLMKLGRRIAETTEKELASTPTSMLISCIVGLIGGLLIAFLINPLITGVIGENIVSTLTSIGLYAILGYLGIRLGSRLLEDGAKLRSHLKISQRSTSTSSQPKILDTSVIIDGRIADICKTGFIEGELMIPEFVLKELQYIADSGEKLKRVRGRRGLDIVKILQNDIDMPVNICEEDFEDETEVDIKLLRLAQKVSGTVVTNDYNLNKVAAIHGVKVLNINELTLSLKSAVLPGEEMVIDIVKEGRERGQGVGYLDDGTMIVVEDGFKLIGTTIPVVVTSALQTAAGRMIFARTKG